MPFRVSGKNIEVGEALRERISARVLESLQKYFDGGFSGHVTVGKEGLPKLGPAAFGVSATRSLPEQSSVSPQMCRRLR